MNGQLLDGRNRWRACEIAEVEPIFRDWSGDSPTAFVISMNARRRQLTPSQSAVVAVEALPMFEAEAKKRMSAGGGDKKSSDRSGGQKIDNPMRASEQAADALGTNRQYVSDVKAVAKSAPHLVSRIKSGELNSANRVVTVRLETEDHLRPAIKWVLAEGDLAVAIRSDHWLRFRRRVTFSAR